MLKFNSFWFYEVVFPGSRLKCEEAMCCCLFIFHFLNRLCRLCSYRNLCSFSFKCDNNTSRGVGRVALEFDLLACCQVPQMNWKSSRCLSIFRCRWWQSRVDTVVTCRPPFLACRPRVSVVCNVYLCIAIGALAYVCQLGWWMAG